MRVYKFKSKHSSLTNVSAGTQNFIACFSNQIFFKSENESPPGESLCGLWTAFCLVNIIIFISIFFPCAQGIIQFISIVPQNSVPVWGPLYDLFWCHRSLDVWQWHHCIIAQPLDHCAAHSLAESCAAVQPCTLKGKIDFSLPLYPHNHPQLYVGQET